MAIGRTFTEALGKAWRGARDGRRASWGRRTRIRAHPDGAAPVRDATEHRLCGRGGARGRRARSTRSPAASAIDPWFVDQIAADASRRAARCGAGRSRRSRRGGAARGQAAGVSDARIACAHGRDRGRRSARHRDALGVRRCSRRSTRAPGSSRRGRRTTTRRTRTRRRSARGAAARGHPGRGPEPDRPGDRVRLRLRARGLRAGGGGLRDGDGELEPGDGLDRLRHERPPVLRAAHRRGRARSVRAPSSPSA